MWKFGGFHLSHSQRTYSFNQKIIEKFDSVVPIGKRSKTLETLISDFNSKSTSKKKNSEKDWILSQIHAKKTKPLKQHGVPENV